MLGRSEIFDRLSFGMSPVKTLCRLKKSELSECVPSYFDRSGRCTRSQYTWVGPGARFGFQRGSDRTVEVFDLLLFEHFRHL